MTAPERFAEKSDSLLHRGRRPYMAHNVTSAGFLAVVHNTYAAASIAAAETTKTTAMSTTAHM